MVENVVKTPISRPVRVRGIALPIEHGSWGFVLEPLVAGLIVAFSPAAPFIAVMVMGAFLSRQPLKIFFADRMAKRDLPQTAVALRYALIYASVAAIGFLGTLYLAPAKAFLPLVVVAPLAALQIYYDASRKSRELLPELTGAISAASTAAILALADNWTLASAFALWAIFAARTIPSILYVRNRLRLEKGKTFSQIVPFAAHLLALVVVSALAYYNFSSLPVVAMFAFLLARGAVGLSKYRKKIKAMRIGIWEVVYGTLVVISVVIGYFFFQ